jgi:transposase
VSAIARSNGLRPQQIFKWRRKAATEGGLRDVGKAVPSFAKVTIEAAAAGGMVELVVSGVTMRIGATVPAIRVTELLRAVRSA